MVEEVFDVLGDKQNVAFDDLAKLHQLGLVKCFFKCSNSQENESFLTFFK